MMPLPTSATSGMAAALRPPREMHDAGVGAGIALGDGEKRAGAELFERRDVQEPHAPVVVLGELRDQLAIAGRGQLVRRQRGQPADQVRSLDFRERARQVDLAARDRAGEAACRRDAGRGLRRYSRQPECRCAAASTRLRQQLLGRPRVETGDEDAERARARSERRGQVSPTELEYGKRSVASRGPGRSRDGDAGAGRVGEPAVQQAGCRSVPSFCNCRLSRSPSGTRFQAAAVGACGSTTIR